MNYDFSIESSIEKIQNANTKEYFKEVYQTFSNGNYRSSIVMLYSVLICDLVYKLRDLRDIYSDTKAKKILEDIENLQNANQKSPEWESKLIEFINTRTSLLEPSDIVAIESLQKFRHLSAHPILTNSDLLYSPNKDTVQSLIRNILEGVLTNPPFFSNKIFDTFLKDLDDIKEVITDNDSLEKYLKSRYLKRLKDTDFNKLFRSHWKIVFISDDTKSTENRTINFRALHIIIKNNRETCLTLIQNEMDYYSNITKNESLTNIIILLSRFPEIFKMLDSSLRLLLTAHIAKNDNLRFISWFQSTSLKEHLNSLDFQEINIQNTYIIHLKKIALQNDCIEDFVNYLINYFGGSLSFDNAQSRFDNAVVEIAKYLTLEQAKTLLKLSNLNSQIYHRIGMSAKLWRLIEEKYETEIEKIQFTNLFK